MSSLRVVWQPEKCKKNKEKEEKEEQVRELKASRQKEILLMKESLYSAWLGGFYSQPLIQNTKKPKENTITMGKIRKKAKKMINISQKVNRNMNSAQERQFRTSAKFSHHGAKFSHCGAKFSAAPSFLQILICNIEFDSNSSCLDRLDNLGINSLQKIQN